MYTGLRIPNTLHKKPCHIEPGLCGTSENFYSTTFVNRAGDGPAHASLDRCYEPSSEPGRRGSAFHAGRVLVGRHSPTPTTCKCPSVCWAAERDCPSLAFALAASTSPSSAISSSSGPTLA